MRAQQKYYIIGLMSGTSLDGLDVCYVAFDSLTHGFEIIQADTIPYTNQWESKLRSAVDLSAIDLLQLDVDYGVYLGKKVNEFIAKYKLKQVDAIASHGHTIFHQPHRKITLQIGHGAAIFHETKLLTITDFRTQDVIFGGQGAPLVPLGDEILFSEYAACLNLGGFSNISFKANQQRVAFDICPVNIVLNTFALEKGLSYDHQGELASNGQVIPMLLDELNRLTYYQLPFPKSLGYEWVNAEVWPILNSYAKNSVEDRLCTFVHHIALQIAKTFNEASIASVLITGGGTKNNYLIECVQKHTDCHLIIPANELIDYKEALIFAFLGFRRLQKKHNILASVTGASRDHCSGTMYGDF